VASLLAEENDANPQEMGEIEITDTEDVMMTVLPAKKKKQDNEPQDVEDRSNKWVNAQIKIFFETSVLIFVINICDIRIQPHHYFKLNPVSASADVFVLNYNNRIHANADIIHECSIN